MRAGVDPVSVDVIFLSHLHFDHIADIPYFMLTTWIFDRRNVPVIVGPPETEEFIRHLLAEGAFAKDIEARAQYLQRQNNLNALLPDIRECKPGLVFEDDLVRVTACHVEHIPREISPCFALRLDTSDGQSIVFSGDTAPCDRLIELAKDCDLLIHECTFPQKAIDFRAKAGIGTWAHTSPVDLGKIAVAARAKSLVATHFGHFDTTNPVLRKHVAKHMPIELVGPEFMEEIVADIRKTYSGSLRIAHDLMRIDI
jgi:ribonuclease Z